MHFPTLKLNLARLSLFLVLGLTLATVLSACGDPTATQVPPATATTSAPATATPATANAALATTAATTAASKTTAAATTVPATPAATTAPATTKAATTSAVTTSGASGSKVSLPNISGAKEVTFDPSILKEFTSQVPGGDVKIFVSDDDPAKLAANAHVALLNAGYQFGIPNQTDPVKSDSNDSYAAVYTKTGSSDVVVITSEVPKDEKELEAGLGVPNLNQDAVKQLLDQVKGRKSSIFLIVDPSGILSGLIAGFAGIGSTTPDTTTGVVSITPVPATTKPVSNKPLEADESVIPLYPGAKRSAASPGKVGNQLTVYYLTGDKYDLVGAWVEKTYDTLSDKGFNSRSFSSSGQIALLSGANEKIQLKMTFVGPRLQNDPDYKGAVAAAKPGKDETIIIVSVVPAD